MRLLYEIRWKDENKFVYLICDPPQYLDEPDLFQWMRETRDDDPDLYAEIVQAYFQWKKNTRKEI